MGRGEKLERVILAIFKSLSKVKHILGCFLDSLAWLIATWSIKSLKELLTMCLNSVITYIIPALREYSHKGRMGLRRGSRDGPPYLSPNPGPSWVCPQPAFNSQPCLTLALTLAPDSHSGI